MGNFDFQCTVPVLGQHWADLNADIGTVTLANLWLPRLVQYWAVFSVPAIRTWDATNAAAYNCLLLPYFIAHECLARQRNKLVKSAMSMRETYINNK